MTPRQKYDIILAAMLATFIVVSGLLVWWLIRPSLFPPPAATDDAWVRIQANGEIVVGTSADYPPFAFYDENFILTGFDIALMQEIGQKLGVRVLFKDIAFDGLVGALQLNQIDAAISAISITPEREQVVDFSTVYFAGEDAVLAAQILPQNSPLAINSMADMTPYRIGVQQGTVYHHALQTNLVETEQMSAHNLFVYQQVDTAVADLAAGRIDLVWLDLQPAQVAVSLNGNAIVGQGLMRQLIAIAVNNGQLNLQTKLNEALAALQREGRIAQLLLDYMRIPPDQIMPPPTAVPAAASVPTVTPPPCIDSMQYVADLNLDDNQMRNPPQTAPGATFQKGWRIRNAGTCTWQTNYTLLYVNGSTPAARMNGSATFVQSAVAPGQTTDIWVTLVAPLQPGTYQGIWSLHNSQGVPFGDRIWVGVAVPAPATATAHPTQTPAANIQFTVSPNPITAGQCAVFNWDVTGATAVYFYTAGQNWQLHQAPPQGDSSHCPTLTTYYELRILWPDAPAEIREIALQVLPATGAPLIEQFSLQPPGHIFAGQCVNISWRVSGSVHSVTILRQETAVYANAPLNGALSDCPPGSGVITYAITTIGPGGAGRQQQTLNVILPATQPPPPTAVPPIVPPAIDRFSVRPAQITQGDCLDISWGVIGQASLIQMKRNGIVVLDNAGYSGVVSDCLNVTGTVTYRIEASNQAGGFAFQEATVQIEPAAQPGLSLEDNTR